MKTKPENRTALVTGAGRGIGKAIAIKLASKGIKVALTARTESELNDVKEEITQSGGAAESFTADVSNEADIQSLITNIIDRLGTLNIVINNAGTGIYKNLKDTTTEDWDTTMSVNARGTFLVCREALQHLRKHSTSWIINISSVVGVKGYVNQAAYSASKHAVMGMTKALAREVQDDGIRVHAICPGGVDTEMVTQARPDIDKADLIDPEDIAETVLFLLNQSGNAVIDEIHIRRASSTPWA